VLPLECLLIFPAPPQSHSIPLKRREARAKGEGLESTMGSPRVSGQPPLAALFGEVARGLSSGLMSYLAMLAKSWPSTLTPGPTAIRTARRERTSRRLMWRLLPCVPKYPWLSSEGGWNLTGTEFSLYPMAPCFPPPRAR
jgi:hypothetical protein